MCSVKALNNANEVKYFILAKQKLNNKTNQTVTNDPFDQFFYAKPTNFLFLLVY